MTDAGTPSKSKKKASKSYAFTGPGSHDPGPEDKDLSDVELSQLSQQLQGSERPNSSGGGMISCQDLKDTPLGIYLTNKARGICARDLVIKVVADVPKQTSASKGSGARSGGSADSSAGQGQENCRRKAIFAFQRVDNGEHFVLCFGMYVHEYGAGCSSQHVGRIYVECVDSVPLYGLERGEERQALLSGIVLSYFDYARSMGFRYAHVHVPPPTEENSHIFASRSLVVRLRASLHLAYWYKRLVITAKQANIITGYEVGQTGDMLNFPMSMLSPSELNAEHAFRDTDVRVLDQQTQRLMERVSQLQDRFFVIGLQSLNSAVQLVPDTSPVVPSSVAADRGEFVGICVSQRLRFATLQQAKYATMMLVHRMISEQRSLGASSALEERFDGRFGELPCFFGGCDVADDLDARGLHPTATRWHAECRRDGDDG